MDKETLTFIVDRITYQNETNGFSVLKGSSKNYPHGVTVVGNFININIGEEVKAKGVWTCHPTFGMQFQALTFYILKPATLIGIEKYIGSGLIKGIGPATAKKLVDAFGLDTLDVIEKQPERLAECPGIGKTRADLISKGWFVQRAIQDTMVFLQSHSISAIYAAKIYSKFGDKAVKVVSANPYLLANEIEGIGFKRADAIAQALGIEGTDLRRLTAGVLYALSHMTKEGHLFLTSEQLQTYMSKLLDLPSNLDLSEPLNLLLLKNQVVIREYKDKKLYYPPYLYYAENDAAMILKVMAKTEKPMDRARLLSVFDEITKSGLNLTDLQLTAVEMSLKNRLLVVTGGPGTGKTTTLKTLVKANQLMGRTVLLASPTGRAAKRLAEVSGYEAQTIHRLLAYSPQEHAFAYNRTNPLTCDTVIIDEASMLDMSLFYSLLLALPDHASLVMVGDVDQLPSVGAGFVLNELIKSQVIPVVSLDIVFRQAQDSNIVKNAHLINKGQLPQLIVPDGVASSDCYFLKANESNRVLSLLKNVVSKSLPARFNLNPVHDIQVLTPMNKGILGADNLNKILRELLNPAVPGKAELELFERSFREGDKVVQLRNNYDLEVYNGDIGIVTKVNQDLQEAEVEFSQGVVRLQDSDFADLAFAYALTVHKAQGSEYPGVVLLLSTQHHLLLQRNLLYTGLTRAKKVMVMLGSTEALNVAVKKNVTKKRNTLLGTLLRS